MKKSNISILVCGHDQKFLAPLIRRLEGMAEGISVRILPHAGHHITDERAAEEALDWADVIWCEWALGNAAWFSQRKRDDQVLIVRLHLQEVQARDRIDFIWAIDWEKVDRLILITHHVYDWIRREFPILASRATLVYNPIPARESLNLPKLTDTRFVLGFVGVVPARKRLDIAIDVLKRLHVTDKRYVLRIKGALPSDYPWMAQRTAEMNWYAQVFESLRELREVGRVIFEPHGPDMAEWYKGIGHILSVSDFEGSHQAVAEGMASGCVPAIRDWEGADRIYPAKYVGPTAEVLANLILNNTEVSTFERESEYCRAFAQERFDETPVCDAMESIIAHEQRRKASLQCDVSEWHEVLFATPTVMILAYIPIESRSGYRIRVEQEIQILIQQGCIVHLVCLLPKQERTSSGKGTPQDWASREQAHVQEFAAMGCTVHPLEVHDLFRMNADASSFPEVTTTIAALVTAHHVDVIHAEALYCARLAATVKQTVPGVVFSIDWHGVIPEETRMGGAHENRVKALEAAEQLMLRGCDLNVFVSQAMQTHYGKKYGLQTLRHVTVPCCVSDHSFPVLDQDDAASLTDNDHLLFAYAGTMADWQCGAEMIEIFSALHRYDARCRFMLLVPKSDQPKVQEYAQRSGLPQEAFKMTEVAHHEVPGRLRDCHVGVLLRKNDPVNIVSSPTKFGEYLAAGLPVLMTDGIGDFSQLVIDQKVGFVVKSEYLEKQELLFGKQVLSDLVEFAEEAKNKKPSMRRTCQTIARDLLMWESAARKWITAYQNLPIEAHRTEGTSVPKNSVSNPAYSANQVAI